MDRFLFNLFGTTSIVVLLELVLLFFVIKAIKIHNSAWIIFSGIVLNILFSLAARIYGYISFQNAVPLADYSRTYAVLANFAVAGQIVEIIGLCIFFSVIVKKCISEKK